jgi:hypothetical protein
MDAIRSKEVPAGEAGDQQFTVTDSGEAKPTRVALFTRIAVGDAP